MATITWAETIPSITSAVGAFPRYAQSVWTAISQGMATEHLWDGSGGASGASRGLMALGGSRAFFDVRSNSSAPNSQMTGRLFFASDTSALLAYDSTGTYQVGTPFLDENATSAFTGYWVRQASTVTGGAGGSSVVTFTVPFLATPNIWFTPSTQSWYAATAFNAVSAATFQVSFISQLLGGAGSFATIAWEALGRVSSKSY